MNTFRVNSESSILPIRMVWPCCSMGGLARSLWTLVSGLMPEKEPRARILALTLTLLSLPTCTVILPAPESTSRFTGPETSSDREKLPYLVSPRLQEARASANARPHSLSSPIFSLLPFLPPPTRKYPQHLLPPHRPQTA